MGAAHAVPKVRPLTLEEVVELSSLTGGWEALVGTPANKRVVLVPEEAAPQTGCVVFGLQPEHGLQQHRSIVLRRDILTEARVQKGAVVRCPVRQKWLDDVSRFGGQREAWGARICHRHAAFRRLAGAARPERDHRARQNGGRERFAPHGTLVCNCCANGASSLAAPIPSASVTSAAAVEPGRVRQGAEGRAEVVRHTGDFRAAVQACAFVDVCLKRLYQGTVAVGGALLVTADHGNAEEMVNPQTGAIEKDHTSNNVPIHYVLEQLRRTTARSEREVESLLAAPIGVLADVGPTILEILDVQKPAAMHGVSLLNSLQ